MSLEEIVTIGGVIVLIALVLTSVLIGYGRRIGIIWKTIGWALVVALIALPLAVFVLNSQLSMDRMGEMADGGSEAMTEGAEAPEESAAQPEGSRAKTAARKPSAPKTTASPPKPSSAPEESEVAALELSDEEEITEAAVAEEEDFKKVEVLFGTDRNKIDGEKRLGFGSQRSGALTLGQASVTIPKQHEKGIVERPWELTIVGITIYKQAEDPAKHLTIQKIGALSEDEFVGAANALLAKSSEFGKQAVIFVHGYNNDFDSALYRSAQMIYDMRFDGAPFLYSWPSAAGYASYETDQQSVRQSITHLRRFIKIVTERTNADKIHLVAHSMGNDLLLEALRELRFEYGPDHDYKINQIVLAAPDVDRNVFESFTRQIAGMGRGMTLYASANDKALQASKAYAGGYARAGDVPPDGPVVLNGLDTIDVSATQQDFWGLNHNTYAEISELVADIRKLLLTGERPPKNRTPELQPVTIQNGTYWRFPASP